MFGYMLEEFKKKSLKIDCANMKNRKNKSVFEKIHSTYSSFHQHVKLEDFLKISIVILMENDV